MSVQRLVGESVGALRTLLGEGARWDAVAGLVRFVDYDASALHAFSPATGRWATVSLDRPLAAVANRGDRTFVGTGRTGFATWDPVTGRVPLGPELADGHDEWLNDGRCDPEGRFWAATATRGGREGTGRLFRLGRDGVAAVALDGLSFGNGIGFSPDATTLYLADTMRRTVTAYPLDMVAGTLGAGRPFVTLPDEDGLPDGLAVDLEGGVWLAVCGAGEVRRYAPDGTLTATVTVDAALVTSCALGGPDGDELFVTSASAPATDGPLAGVELGADAGALFRVRVDVRGLTEAGWAG